MRRRMIVGIMLILLVLGMLTFSFRVEPLKAQPVHDVAVTGVVPSRLGVAQGFSLPIEVTVENQGDLAETFNVTAYYNWTAIILPDGETNKTVTLSSGNSETITFVWNTSGVALGNYGIFAKAWPVPGETDTVDNEMFDGVVRVCSLIIVPDHYETIQGAIDNASPWDTVFVRNGTYPEKIGIDKALTLISENRSNTIINGINLSYTTGALVTIGADNVDMSGFTVRNAKQEGIGVADSRYCEVHETIVCFTGDRGICLSSARDNTVYNNIVYNSSDYGGIDAVWSSNNTIYNNIAYFNRWGISTNHGSYNRIYCNTVYSNRGAGIHIDWPSTGNIVQYNNVSSNTNDGIRVMNQVNETVISGNKISENDCGIFFANSPNNTISGNYITTNAAAVAIVSSENNSFYHNNFIGNAWQVHIVPSGYVNFWDDGYPHGGNYWSDYTGGDLYSGLYQNETGSDGIGDVPYIIDAYNVDNYPLMRARYYEDRMTQVVSTESTGSSHCQSLAVDSSGNVHVAWHDNTTDYAGSGSDWDIFYKRFEVGSGWTPTEVVSTESNGISLHPSLAVDSSGNVHVAWYDETDYAGSGSDWDIFYKRFVTSSGWTSTEVVSTQSTAGSGEPSLAVDSSGNIHIAWHDLTDYAGCGSDFDVFYKRYELGVGWTSTEVVSTNSTAESAWPSLAVDSAGNVHIAWDDLTDYAGSGGNDSDIFYKKYELGVGWTSTEVVSTESTATSWIPSLAVDSSGNVHVAWYDETDYAGSGSDWDIFYKRFVTSSGWTSTEVVSTESTLSSNRPSLAVDSSGNIHMAWQDETDYAGSDTDLDIFYKRYEVSVGWTSTEVVSTESTQNSWIPSLAVDSSGNVHVAWADYTDYAGCGSDPDIFYKYICLHSTQYPWPMFRHNLRHTGYTESPAPRTNQTLWNYTTGDWVESSPAVADGLVFVGSDDGNVYALDQHTGTQVWNYTTGLWLEVMTSPAVAYGKVYVGASDTRVYCLDASTGEQIWNYTTGGGVWSSPTVVDGRVYVGSGDESWDTKVYCIDAATGILIWNQTTGAPVGSSPAVADGKVYVGSSDGKFYCLDASTGEHIWNQTTSWWVSSPAVAYGKVYVGASDTRVYCLDASTGEQIWNYTTGGGVWSSPAVADGRVYVGSYDNKIYCFDAITGAHIWNQTTGDLIESSPAVADGKVYVGSDDGKVYCLDASTGDIIWSYTTGDSVWSSPAVADGVVFVGSNDNKVYALGEVIRVPEDYPTVQDAIDAASPGATIKIASGIYHEYLVVNKTLTFQGAEGNTTDFEGGGSGIAWNITHTSEVIVTNIRITNYDQGICILNSSNCKIYCNIFRDNNIAINITETSTNNIIYHNNFLNNTLPVSISMQAENIWDNGYPSGGNYWSDQTGTDENKGPNQDEPGSDGVYDTAYSIDADNRDNYPLTKPYGGPYDIGITTITTSKTVIAQGYNLNITVKVLNYGIDTETLNITVYAHTTIINQKQTALRSRNSTTVTFTWNTTGAAKGSYIIDAYATSVPGETDTADNALTDGSIKVSILGDINGDFKVDIVDLVKVIRHYGSYPGHPDWNPNADVNCDGKVDIVDLVKVIRYYGTAEP